MALTASTGLVKPSLQAGIAFALLLAALTFGPYFWEKSHAAARATTPSAEKNEQAPAAAPTQPETAPAPSTPSSPSSPAAKPPTGSQAAGLPTKGPASKGDIIEKLGENVKKEAPSKVNPLDKKEDDLLKDIK